MQGNETNEILQRLVRVETKIDLMITARDIAQEALLNTRSSHHRIDRLDKIVFWSGTTIIGTVATAIITFFMKGGMVK